MIVCGTGHRPKDLPCKYSKNHPFYLEKEAMLIELLKKEKPNKVISGGAIGFDQMLLETAIKLGLNNHVYIPFKGHDKIWPEKTKAYLKQLLKKTKEVKYICEGGFVGWKMHARNEAMVNDSDLVVALWNPDRKEGGTYSCIKYALKAGKPIINLWGIAPIKLQEEKLYDFRF